ncbi:MAG: AAA family ATPase [bacterium]
MGKTKPEFYPKIFSSLLNSENLSLKREFYALFADISGFTQISESLMSGGFEGAEKIRDIINSHFDFFSRTIYSNGGDILQYSGDAILSIFSEFESAARSMEMIIEFTRNSGVLSIRGGLSFGEIDFKAYEFNGGYLILSKGDCVERAMNAEHTSDIMSYNVNTSERKSVDAIPTGERSHTLLDRSISKVFETCSLDYGSFAFSSVLFLFAEERDIPFILKLAEGRLYLNKIEKYPEGIRLFFLSGVLDAKCNPVESMLEFVADIDSSSIKDRIFGGFTSGYMFNGFTGSEERCEYNLIGKSINRAARIAAKSRMGEMLFDKEILEETSSVSGEFIRSENLKGIGIVNLYRLKEYRKHSVPLYLPIFGREREMENLESLLKEKTSVVVSGESGSGKTHFVSSFIYEKNVNALYLNISDSDTLNDYSILKILNLDVDEETSKEGAYRKFLEFMLAQSEKRILVIDNYEKLDEKSSIIVKEFLNESVTIKAILISSAMKGDIELGIFNADGISGMIETRTGIQPSAFLSDAIFKKTNGNPYFVLAFFKSLVGDDQIEMNYLGEWDLNENKSVVSSEISSSVQMVFSSLSILERNILKISSVFDFGCPEDILMQILRESEIEIVSKTIMELVQKNILQKRERKVSFVNDIVREHVYKSILDKEKTSLHRLAAKSFTASKEDLEAGRHFFLSGDLAQSKNLLKRYSELIEDGKFSMALYYAGILFRIEKTQKVLTDIITLLLKEGRYQEAEKLFNSEKSLLDSDGALLLTLKFLVFKGDNSQIISFASSSASDAKSEETLFYLIDEAAFAMAIIGDSSALEYADRALRLFENGKISEFKKIKLGGTYRQLGDYEKVENIYRIIHRRAIENNDMISAYAALSEMIEMMPPGRYTVDYTVEINEKFLSLLKEKDRKREELKAMKVLTMRLRDRGEYAGAMDMGLRAIGLARILKDSVSETVILSQLARMEFNRGDMNKALELFESARILAEKNNFLLLLESIYGNMGVLMHVMKDYAIAYELYEKALEISLKVKHSDTRFLWILNLALLGIESKQIQNVENYILMAREELVKSNIPERWIDVEQIAANCAFLQGNYKLCMEKAKMVLNEAEKRNETEIYFETLPYYAGALILCGDSTGEEMLGKAQIWADEKNSDNVKKNIADVRRVLPLQSRGY